MDGNQMTKTMQTLTLTATGLTLSLLALDVNPVQAATITYEINISPTSGPLVGSSLSGFVTYNDSGLTNVGSESLPISNFSLTFQGTNYTKNDDPTATVDFSEGDFLGLNYAIAVPGFSLVSGSFTLNLQDAYFTYDLGEVGQNGDGNVTYSLGTTPVDVPEPSSLLGVGVLGLTALLSRKSKLSKSGNKDS